MNESMSLFKFRCLAFFGGLTTVVNGQVAFNKNTEFGYVE